MYLGKLVELGTGDDIYRRPAHPYTDALIKTIPVPDPAVEQAKTEVGDPRRAAEPDQPAVGLPLPHPLPARRRTLCAEEEPLLRAFGPGHQAACHFPLTARAGAGRGRRRVSHCGASCGPASIAWTEEARYGVSMFLASGRVWSRSPTPRSTPDHADDAPRRDQPHHRDHRRRAAQRRLLHRRARPAPGDQDRQPGRPDRLPPLLRRRGRLSRRGHDLLRVPRRRARPGRRGLRLPRDLARRLARLARLLGATAWRSTASSVEQDAMRFASRTRRGSSTSSWSRMSPTLRCAARHPEIPPEHALLGFAGVRAYSLREAASQELLIDVLGAQSRADGRSSCAAHTAARRSAGTRRRRARARAGGRLDPPHRLGHDGRRAPALAPARERRRGAKHPHNRPPLLPLDLLPRAGRGAVRDRRRRPRLRPRRAGQRARPPGSSCRPGSRPRRAEIEARLTPLPDPRAGWPADF